MSNPNDFTRKKPGQKKKSKARNRLKLQAPPIKLFLSKYKADFRGAIRHALDNQYRWTPFNIQEIRTYMNEIQLNLNPVTMEVVMKEVQYVHQNYIFQKYVSPYTHGYNKLNIHIAKDFYDTLDLEWNIPPCFLWIHRLIYLWEISRKKYVDKTPRHIRGKYWDENPKPIGLRDKNLAVKEWFHELDLPFPSELESVSDEVITNRKDLERTGIFEALDLKIKESLGIEDELEKAYHNWDSLDILEKAHIKILINTKAVSKKHPYYILLKENIEQD